MSEPTPMPVPEGLRGLAAHDPEVIGLLRALREALERRSPLDERTVELVRLGALVGLGAPAGSLDSHVRRLRALGASPGDVWGVVTAVLPLVGVARVVAAGEAITAAIEEAQTDAGD